MADSDELMIEHSDLYQLLDTQTIEKLELYLKNNPNWQIAGVVLENPKAKKQDHTHGIAYRSGFRWFGPNELFKVMHPPQ